MDFSQPTNNKTFPWVQIIQKEFLKSFSKDYDQITLQLLQKYVEEELLLSRKHSRRCVLFETLIEFYTHFCWKTKWNEPSLSMKDACIQLLANMTKVGVLLSKGDPDSDFCSRVLSALKMFPGDDNLLYTALLQVTHLNEKYHKAYGGILKLVMYSSPIKPNVPQAYLKAMLLLKRLKFILKGRSQKTQVFHLAVSTEPPPDTCDWLSSHCPDYVSGTRLSQLCEKIMTEKIPVKLREVLLPTLSGKSKISFEGKKLKRQGCFVIDNAREPKNDSENHLISSTEHNLNLHSPSGTLSSEEPSLLHSSAPSRKRRRLHVTARQIDMETDSVDQNYSPAKNKHVKEVQETELYLIDSSATIRKSTSLHAVKSQLDLKTETVNQNTSSVSPTNQLGKAKSTELSSSEESSLVYTSAPSRKSKRLHDIESQLDLQTNSGDQNTNSVCLDENQLGKADEDKETLSDEEASLDYSSAPSAKSTTLHAVNNHLVLETDIVDQNNSSIPAVSSQEEKDDENRKTSSREEHSAAPSKKRRRLHVTESQLGIGIDFVDQNNSFVDQNNSFADNQHEKEAQEAELLSIEEPSLSQSSVPTRKSKRLHAIESSQDVDSDSVDQKNSSVSPACSQQEKETELLSFEEPSFVHSSVPTRKSKRLPAIESPLDVDSDPVGQNDSSVSPACSHQEKETEILSVEEPSRLHSSVPTRKSKRLHAIESPLDVENQEKETELLSVEEPSVVHSSVPTRKSKRLHAIESPLDVDSDSVRQNNSSVSPACSHQEKETELLSVEEPSLVHSSVPTRKSKRLHAIECSLDVDSDSVGQNNSSVSPACSQQEKETEILSVEEPSLVQSSVPTRKSKRLHAVNSHLGPETESVDGNISSVYPVGNHQEKKDEDGGNSSNEESDAVYSSVTTRNRRRLHSVESRLDPSGSQQEKEAQETENLFKEESSSIDLSASCRRSKGLFHSKSQLDPKADVAEQDGSIDGKQEAEGVCIDAPLKKESLLVHSHLTSRKSKTLLAVENKIFPEKDSTSQFSEKNISCEVAERPDFEVIETDTGFKIAYLSEQRSSLEKSSEAAPSRAVKTSELLSPSSASPETSTISQNIPVVVISPAEGSTLCTKYVPLAVDNHLLHPSKDSHSETPNDKRPDCNLGEKVPSQSNVFKLENKSTDSEVPNPLKDEDDPVSSSSTLKISDEASSTDYLEGNLRVKNENEGDSKVEISSPDRISDTIVSERTGDLLKDHAVKYGLGEVPTSLEEGAVKVTPEKIVICNKSNLGAVSAMTFSPLVNKSKHYLSFNDVTHKNESDEERANSRTEDSSTEFSGYRDLEDDLCDNKSESVLSEIIKMDHASSDASVCDNHDEDFDDDALAFPATSETEGTEVSTGFETEKFSEGPQIKVEVKDEENESIIKKEGFPDGISISPCEENPKISPSSPTAEAGIKIEVCSGVDSDKASAKEAPDTSSNDKVGVSPVKEISAICSQERKEDKRVPAVRVKVELQGTNSPPPPSNKDVEEPAVEDTVTAARTQKRVMKSALSSRTSSTSSGYSLRRTTRSRAQVNVQLGLDFTKLNLGSPAPKSKKVTFKVDEIVKVKEEVDAKPSRRTTRSSTAVVAEPKPEDQTSNAESHNLRRSKRSVVLPGKLNLQ